jgi:uncharacterized membrane protein
MLLALGFIGAYVLLVGIASFLEGPLSRQIDPLRLDAALRIGALVLALAALFVSGEAVVPPLASAAGGFVIGCTAGAASVCYCIALSRTHAWLAASIANGYVAVTAALGVVVLGDAFDRRTAVGLALTLVGVVALSRRGSSDAKPSSDSSVRHATLPLLGYILLAGISTFLEKPALGALAPLQLNALTALGMAAVGVVAAGVRDRALPAGSPALAAAGIGAMIGLGAVAYFLGLARLPVSIAAALGNTYVLVTTALAVLLRHQTLGRWQIAGALGTVAGVCVLSLIAS